MIFDCIGVDVGAWVGVGFRVGAGAEAGVGGDVRTGVGIGVSVHTPHLETSEALRHRKSSTTGWRGWSTVHRKLSPTRDDQCTTASPRAHRRVFFFLQRGISVRAQQRFFFDTFEVHGNTFAVARIRIIVIARVPPLTGATDLMHVLVSEPLLPLVKPRQLLERALCEEAQRGDVQSLSRPSQYGQAEGRDPVS